MNDLIGRTLGHYRIVEQIGVGGMGVVYRAHDERLDRDVAIKVLREEVAADPDRLRRFEREAKAVAALSHPNILEIFDFETDGEVTYSVTELLEGETLGEHLNREPGPLPWRRVQEIGVATASGLGAAHSKGVVHRDIKPSNIFLCADGRIKILDFGLAATHEVVDREAETRSIEAPLTREGTVMGTVGYMSPEQAAGRTVDARSDIFSLGAVLYEMLAGRRPFGGSSGVETLAALLRDDPPPLEGIDSKVARVVAKCLVKDPGDRFQTADELRAAIDGHAAPDADGERASIAVLPFANMSGKEEDDFLCEGLAEEIINVLTRVPGLRVIARTSSFAVARMGLDVREAGARLDVESILEGSVRRAGQRVRITVQLVTTADGSHLWSDRFDRELTDILALEDEIAEAIAERLKVDVGHSADERQRPAVDVDAYHAFLEGRYHFARGTPEALAKAMACFERAVEQDPNFALAFDSIAELYWYLGLFGGVQPRDAFSQGTWHAMRALELDDTLAQTHALLGMFRKELDYNWPEVEREMRRAHELNRESSLVRLRYAISGLLPHGRMDEAEAEVEGALESDPLSIFVRWWLAVMAYLGRRMDRALDEGRHMIDLDPSHFLGYWPVGMAAIEKGQLDEAAKVLGKSNELSGGIPFTRGFLAYGYGRAGRTDDALRLLEEAKAMAAESYLPPSTLALGYSGLGDWNAAFHWWDLAVELRDPLIVPIKTYPFFDPVRNDPRYFSLLKKMNLAES